MFRCGRPHTKFMIGRKTTSATKQPNEALRRYVRIRKALNRIKSINKEPIWNCVKVEVAVLGSAS